MATGPKHHHVREINHGSARHVLRMAHAAVVLFKAKAEGGAAAVRLFLSALLFRPPPASGVRTTRKVKHARKSENPRWSTALGVVAVAVVLSGKNQQRRRSRLETVSSVGSQQPSAAVWHSRAASNMLALKGGE